MLIYRHMSYRLHRNFGVVSEGWLVLLTLLVVVGCFDGIFGDVS